MLPSRCKYWNFSAFLLILLLTSIFGSSVAMTQAEETKAQPRYGGTVVLGIPEPEHLNPAISSAYLMLYTTGHICQTLIEMNFEGGFDPELAYAWESSPDGLTWTFHLYDNVTWHDGVKFTSADVKFNYEELYPTYHPTGSIWVEYLDHIETPDDYTVVFKLNKPFGQFLVSLDIFYGAFIPKHLYEGTDFLTNEYNRKSVGTGPFKFEEWVPEEYIILVRNDNYYRKGLPYLDRVIIKFYETQETCMAAFEAGEVDILGPNIPFPDVERFMKMPDVLVSEKGMIASAGLRFFYVNHRPEHVTSDKVVRQAIMNALNRTYMAKTVFYGYEKVATGPIRSDHPPYNPNVAEVYPSGGDPAKAEQLMDAAGYTRGPDGWRFDLTIVSGDPTSSHFPIAEIAQQNLKDIGINAKIESYTGATSTEKIFKTYEFDLAWCGGLMSGPDIIAKTGRAYISTMIKPGVPFVNAGGVSIPRIDELYSLAASAKTFEEYKNYLFEIQEILVDEAASLWVTEDAGYKAYNADFVGFPAGPYGCRSDWDEVWWKLGELPTPTPTPTPTPKPTPAPTPVVPIEELLSSMEALKTSVDSMASKLEELPAPTGISMTTAAALQVITIIVVLIGVYAITKMK